MYGGGKKFPLWDLQQSGFDLIEIATWNFAKEESTDFLESSLENLRFILTFQEIDLARGWKENNQIANFLQNLPNLKSCRNLQTHQSRSWLMTNKFNGIWKGQKWPWKLVIDFDLFNSLDEQKRCSFLEKLLMILTILPWGCFSHSWHVLSAWAWWHRGWRGFWERSTRGWHGRDTGTHGRRCLGRSFSTMVSGSESLKQ